MANSGWIKLNDASKCLALEQLRNSWIYQGDIAPTSPPIPDCLGSCFVSPTKIRSSVTNALSTSGAYSEPYDDSRKICVDVYAGCNSWMDLKIFFDANMQVKTIIDGVLYGESDIGCCNGTPVEDFPTLAQGNHQICVYWKRSGSTRGIVKVLGILWKDGCNE